MLMFVRVVKCNIVWVCAHAVWKLPNPQQGSLTSDARRFASRGYIRVYMLPLNRIITAQFTTTTKKKHVWPNLVVSNNYETVSAVLNSWVLYILYMFTAICMTRKSLAAWTKGITRATGHHAYVHALCVYMNVRHRIMCVLDVSAHIFAKGEIRIHAADEWQAWQ